MKKGFSTIELLIAFAILFIVLPPLMLLAFGGQTSTLDVTLTNGGVTRLTTQMRDAVASTTANWYTTPGTRASSTDPYDEINTSSFISPCLKQITASTSWKGGASAQEAFATTYVPNIAEAKALGGGCDPFPPSTNWDDPASFGSVDVSGSDGTGIDVASISGNRYAFVTADPSALSGDDFIVINASNANNPQVLGTPLNSFKGLNGVVVANKYAYVLNNDNLEQLSVINISNPSAPSEISGARRTLPNIVFTCSPASKPCLSGISVTYHAGRLYVGTSYLAFGLTNQNHELHVYCVDDSEVSGCSPSTPVWLGSYDVNRNVSDIVVRNQTVGGAAKKVAYLAVSGSTISLPEMLILDVTLDVTSTSSISQIGSLNPSGTHYGRSIELLGDIAFLGRERATGSNKDFILVDISNPTTPTQLSAIKLAGLTGSAYVSGIAARGNFAFVATTDSNQPLFIFNVQNPANPLPVSSCGLNFSQVTRDIAYLDDLVFTANRSNDLVRVIYDQPTFCG